MSANLIKKISPKTVLDGSPAIPEKATDLFTVIGQATGVKTGESTYGTWTALTGQFEATAVESGETVQAPVCFLPDPLNGMIAARLISKDKDGRREIESAQFAVMVGVKPAKTATGYEYTVRELVEVEQADPLAALREATAKALPAPAKKK